MSNNVKRPYPLMRQMADKVMERLAPMCSRIEIAGSLRREKPMISDIELVAIPLSLAPRLDGVIDQPYELDGWLQEQKAAGRILLNKDGGKYKQFVFEGTRGDRYTVDLSNLTELGGFVFPVEQNWSFLVEKIF